MADNPIILSLCIPTYNRSQLLMETLAEIASQIRGGAFTESIEITVSDNASSDDTQLKLKLFLEKNKDIKIKLHRQERNLGPDGNIYTVVKMASGTFIWIMSDDDLLFPKALSLLIDLIKLHPDEGAFCPNIRGFTNQLEDAGQEHFKVKSGTIKGKHEGLAHIGYMITFLSVLIFRRCLISDCNYDDRLGTDIIHSYMFLDVLKASNSLYVVAEPLLGCRMFNSGGYNFFRILVNHFNSLLVTAEQTGFSKSIVAAIRRQYLRGFLLDMLYMFKTQGSVGRLQPNYFEAFNMMFPIYYKDPFFYSRIVPYLLCPSFLMRRLVKLKSSLEGRLAR